MVLDGASKGMVYAGADRRWSYQILCWWIDCLSLHRMVKKMKVVGFGWKLMMVEPLNGRWFRLLMVIEVLMQIGNEGFSGW